MNTRSSKGSLWVLQSKLSHEVNIVLFWQSCLSRAGHVGHVGESPLWKAIFADVWWSIPMQIAHTAKFMMWVEHLHLGCIDSAQVLHSECKNYNHVCWIIQSLWNEKYKKKHNLKIDSIDFILENLTVTSIKCCRRILIMAFWKYGSGGWLVVQIQFRRRSLLLLLKIGIFSIFAVSISPSWLLDHQKDFKIRIPSFSSVIRDRIENSWTNNLIVFKLNGWWFIMEIKFQKC